MYIIFAKYYGFTYVFVSLNTKYNKVTRGYFEFEASNLRNVGFRMGLRLTIKSLDSAVWS